MPVWVAAHTVNWPHVAVVVVRVSFGEWSGALVDWAVFCRNEVIVSSIIHWEVNRQTSCVDEGHAAGFLFTNGTCVNIFLVWISFTLKLLEVAVLKALLHGPLNNTTITRDRNKSLSLILSLDPLNFPDNVCVLVWDVFRGVLRCISLSVSNVVNRNISVRVTAGNQMRLFFGELATSDAVVGSDNALGEFGILQSPETEKTIL